MSNNRRLGVLHALFGSIGPTDTAFANEWPEAAIAHLLDGSLYLDRSQGTADEAEIDRRIRHLVDYSVSTGAEGILFTGSFFGDAVRKARVGHSIPILTSFDGLIARTLEAGNRFHLMSTAADSLPLLETDLCEAASSLSLTGSVVDGAIDALLSGSADEHDRLIAEAVSAAPDCDAVVFAQFSMGRALNSVRSTIPILAPAEAAAVHLRRLMSES